MNKKVLAIYFTQSGQMRRIMDAFTQPLVDAGAEVEKVEVKMQQPFPFPWTGSRFFGVMPDCVLSVPHAIEPLQLQHNAYDLIILGYQPWFLSPSIPTTSLLHHAGFKDLLKGTPVVTISEARNMWLNAYERLRLALKQAGANLQGNIALVDRHPNFVSFITIFYWMLTGKKERFLNFFPKPGVDEDEIQQTGKFGQTVAQWLGGSLNGPLQPALMQQDAVNIKYPLMFIEGKAKIIFAAWAKFIVRRKNRAAWISAFKYYLFIALFLGAPVLLTLDMLFIRPFSGKRIQKKKNYYLQLN